MKTRILLVLAAVAWFAVPSFAQKVYDMRPVGDGSWTDTASYEAGEYMDNPCTAVVDWVWVSYTADVYLQGWKTSTGAEPVRFDESTTVGGGTYAAAGTSRSEVAAQQPYSLRKYHKVNTPDNFHVVTVITFDPASRDTTITRETACGNGMPDSIE